MLKLKKFGFVFSILALCFPQLARSASQSPVMAKLDPNLVLANIDTESGLIKFTPQTEKLMASSLGLSTENLDLLSESEKDNLLNFLVDHVSPFHFETNFGGEGNDTHSFDK